MTVAHYAAVTGTVKICIVRANDVFTESTSSIFVARAFDADNFGVPRPSATPRLLQAMRDERSNEISAEDPVALSLYRADDPITRRYSSAHRRNQEVFAARSPRLSSRSLDGRGNKSSSPLRASRRVT